MNHLSYRRCDGPCLRLLPIAQVRRVTFTRPDGRPLSVYYCDECHPPGEP